MADLTVTQEPTVDADGKVVAGDTTDKGGKVTFTADQQTEVDRLIEGRLGREKSTLRKTIEKEFTDKAARDTMEETDRLKAEKADLDKRLSDSTSAAGLKLIQRDARIELLSAGISRDRLDYGVRLIDLSAITIGEDGEPDAEAIKAAVEKLCKDFPELKGSSKPATGAGGVATGGTGGTRTALTQEQINAMTPAELSANYQAVEAFYASRRK